MRNRYPPFGYQICNGELIVHPSEAEIVKKVFTRYGKGETLRAIADDLSVSKVEYLPGKTLWDKSRVKRLLDDRRYVGENGFPAIIAAEQYNSVQLRKDSAGPKPLEVDRIIKLIKATAICIECGHPLTRRVDQRHEISTTWKCPSCRYTITIGDEDLKQRILSILNEIVVDPSLAETAEREMSTESLEFLRSQQEIYRMMASGESSSDDYINVVLRCAAKTYESITSARHITDRLTATLHHAEPLSSFDEKLFLQTVNHILLCRSGEVSLELQNVKIITEMKKQDEKSSYTPKDHRDSSDPTIAERRTGE